MPMFHIVVCKFVFVPQRGGKFLRAMCLDRALFIWFSGQGLEISFSGVEASIGRAMPILG